jgi:hypothetical protein
MLEEPSYKDEATIDVAPESNWVTAITVLSGPNEGDVIAVKGDSFTIGRARSNSVIINNKTASRRHAAIQYKDARYHIFDLGSKWGTKINGSTIKETELKFGDEIEIAGIRYGFGQVLQSSISKSKGKNSIKYVIYLLIFIALAAAATLYYFKTKSTQDLIRPGADVISQVIYHYDRGIDFYNKIHLDESNKKKAVEEMKQVIELDPDGTTQFSRSARRIIDGLGQ